MVELVYSDMMMIKKIIYKTLQINMWQIN